MADDAARLTVVAYDVREDGRRLRVAERLLNYGVRVQLSVFECRLNRRQLDELRHALQAEIDPSVDVLAFYQFCRSCAPTAPGQRRSDGRPSDCLVV
jgi:CRISPR-associated protein Cas2